MDTKEIREALERASAGDVLDPRARSWLSQLCDEVERLSRFAERCLDPEMYGHAVTAEVRDAARVVLGEPPAELHKWRDPPNPPQSQA